MSKYLLSCLAAVLLVTISAIPVFAKAQDIVKINMDIEVPREMAVGDVISIGGNITVSGKVENNVVAIGGSAYLKPGSYVGGQVVVVGGELVKDPYAAVEGKTTQIYMPNFIPSFTNFLKGGWIALWATISILALLGFLGLAILLTALLPEHMGTAVSVLERSFFPMFLWGVLWMVLVVPIALLLAISIIGIILIPLEIMLAVLALILGYIAAAIFIGKNVLLYFKRSSPLFVNAILGIVVLFLIGFVPLVGPLAKAIFLTAGFGAILTTRFGTIR